MTDLISREAAIALLKAIPRDDENDSYASGYNIGLRDCIEELAKVPNANPFAELDRVSDILAARRNKP